jgi:hypothetical protein
MSDEEGGSQISDGRNSIWFIIFLYVHDCNIWSPEGDSS